MTKLLVPHSRTLTSIIRNPRQAPRILALGKGQPGKIRVLYKDLSDLTTEQDAERLFSKSGATCAVLAAGTSPTCVLSRVVFARPVILTLKMQAPSQTYTASTATPAKSAKAAARTLSSYKVSTYLHPGPAPQASTLVRHQGYRRLRTPPSGMHTPPSAMRRSERMSTSSLWRMHDGSAMVFRVPRRVPWRFKRFACGRPG
jgi:hypothetical protein